MPTPSALRRETIPPRTSRLLLVGLGVLAGLVALASIGPGPLPHELILGVSARSLVPLVLAGIYLAGALGWGLVARPLWKNAAEPLALRFGAGLAIQLTLTHALGTLGLLTTATAWGQVLVGLGLLILGCRGCTRGLRLPSPISLACVPGALILVLAAANPPGWLWDTEFGAYDALSYHLQLPREWVESGRIWPNSHNVYSYLPGYIEGAFTHLAHLWPRSAHGVPAIGNTPTLAAQFLHALLALTAAALCGRAAARWIRDRAGLDHDDTDANGRLADMCGWLVAAIVLSTPWTVVTGSLAYNEMGVTVLTASALLAATDRRIGPARRGMLAGALIGVACGVKPTALFLAGGPVGLLLCASCLERDANGGARAPVARAVAITVGAGAVVGLLALAPWLIRNAIASGNPVFPQLTSVFGTGHWSADQVARYAGAHRFDGSLTDRLVSSVAPLYETQSRGLTHPQWAAFFPACAVAAIVAIARRRVRGGSLLLAALAIGVGGWLALTHVQSRFLLPLIVPGSVLIGVGLASVGPRHARTIGGALVAIQALVLLLIFAGQRHGQPNLALTSTPSQSAGAELRTAIEALPPPARREQVDALSPFWYINAVVPAGDTVLLVGGATPFYVRSPVLYATTWDTQPLAEALRRHPDDPALCVEQLREQGIDWILVDFAELTRLLSEGWHDPLETPGAVADVLGPHAELVRHWESLQALFRLTERTGD